MSAMPNGVHDHVANGLPNGIHDEVDDDAIESIPDRISMEGEGRTDEEPVDEYESSDNNSDADIDVYTNSYVIRNLVHSFQEGGVDVFWFTPVSIWINIVNRYLLNSEEWDLTLEGNFRETSLVTASYAHKRTGQPRVNIVTLEETYNGMDDSDPRASEMGNDLLAYAFGQRDKWMLDEGANDNVMWLTTYFICVFGTKCRFFSLEPGETQLRAYRYHRDLRFYDAFEHYWNVNAILCSIKRDVCL